MSQNVAQNSTPQPAVPHVSASSITDAKCSESLPANRLDQLVAKAVDFQTLTSTIVHWIESQSRCFGFWIADAESDGPPLALSPSAKTHWEAVQAAAVEQIELVKSTRRTQVVQSSRIQNRWLVVSPVSIRNELKFVLMGYFESTCERQSKLSHLVDAGRRAIEKWCLEQELNHLHREAQTANRWLEFSNAILRTPTDDELILNFVNQFKRLAQIDQFSIARLVRGKWEVIGVSDCVELDPRVGLQAKLGDLIGNLTPAENWSEIATLTQTEKTDNNNQPADLETYLEQLNATEWACWDIVNNENQYRFFGVRSNVSKLSARAPQPDINLDILRECSRDFVARLEILQRTHSPAASIVLRLRQSFKHRRGQILAGCVLFFLLAMFFPTPYKPACQFELHPVKRRYVSAPFDGILQKCLVEQGDAVTAGQVLAVLDGEAILTEKRALIATISGAKARADAARAEGKIAEAQIAKTEMKRATAELELLDQRLRNLEIRSPLAGVIVSGELEKAEGAPLDIGKVLFEIAPLEKLIVEVQIPEKEIAYVRKGMEVSFRFNAFPLNSYAGILKKIHPKAKLIDDDLVFVGEVEFENASGEFRPGLSGTAKVIADRRALGWNLFHRTYESIRRWITW